MEPVRVSEWRGNDAESESVIPCGREKRGRAGSSISGGVDQEQIERPHYGRAGIQGGSLYDAKGLRPLGPGSDSIGSRLWERGLENKDTSYC